MVKGLDSVGNFAGLYFLTCFWSKLQEIEVQESLSVKKFIFLYTILGQKIVFFFVTFIFQCICRLWKIEICANFLHRWLGPILAVYSVTLYLPLSLIWLKNEWLIFFISHWKIA